MAKGDTEKKEEKVYKPVYLRFGRGDTAEAVTLTPKAVEVICKAVSDQTLKGKMATGGGTTGRTPEGNELANELFSVIKLLQEKAD